mmetsp:Transcript_47648/g.124835  ORF Transcript_47648/g.124835 Transcript_47648/m.124835 type:complete len:214 (-) Transcript_47648:661-1302(-)
MARSGAFWIHKVATKGKRTLTKIHASATPPRKLAAIIGTASIMQSSPPTAHACTAPLTSVSSATKGVARSWTALPTICIAIASSFPTPKLSFAYCTMKGPRLLYATIVKRIIVSTDVYTQTLMLAAGAAGTPVGMATAEDDRDDDVASSLTRGGVATAISQLEYRSTSASLSAPFSSVFSRSGGVSPERCSSNAERTAGRVGIAKAIRKPYAE